MNSVIYGETTGNKLRLIKPRFVSNKYYTQESNVIAFVSDETVWDLEIGIGSGFGIDYIYISIRILD
jgi:hypothetical protein